MKWLKRLINWIFDPRYMNKGGLNDRPTTPRPPPPKGQGVRVIHITIRKNGERDGN